MCPSGSRLSSLGQMTIGRCSNLLQDAESPDTVARGPSSVTVAHTSIIHTSGHCWRSTEYTTSYHPQENWQVEVSNGEVKNILKKIIWPDGKDWVHKLPDTLWAYHTAYKTPIAMSPFWLINRKACHLSVELEHQAYWAIQKLNLSLEEAGKQWLFQLQELQEVRHDAYENTAIYKEKSKAFSWPTH